MNVLTRARDVDVAEIAELKRPAHIIAIPNGNRRKAKELDIPLNESYILGAWKALEFVGWCQEVDAKDATIFGLSYENVENREQHQLDAIVEGAMLFCEHIEEIDCRVHLFGKYEELRNQKHYAELHRRLSQLSGRETSGKFTVHIAVKYSGLLNHETDPLFDAFEQILSVGEQHGFEEARRRLEEMKQARESYILSAGVPKGDLLIRTGGEHRTSGLLPFQVGYAEQCILDVLWADLTKTMFNDAVRWYGMQPRNFGK